MAIYYLDSVNGNDTNDGLSQGAALKSVSYTQTKLLSGDTVYVYPGEYGNYVESGSPVRSSYIKWLGVGEGVNFGSMSIVNLSFVDVFLRFSGINFTPDWVDPASSGEIGSDDPQYADSDQSTYAKTDACVYLTGCRYVEIVKGTLKGTNRHLTPYGVVTSRSGDITIANCEITTVGRGVSLQNGGDTTTQFNINIMYNHIHFFTGSALLHGNIGNYYTLAEGNNCHDCVVDYSEDYAPRLIDTNYHGSGFAIRSGNTTIRKNIFHDGFVSAGVMCYDEDVGGLPTFENILIENNLLYDLSTPYLIRFYLLGVNTVVRNNTLIGYRREATDGRYEYNTAIAVHTLDSNSPTLDINNNILIGLVSVAVAQGLVTLNNNYIWSISLNGVDFVCDGDVEAGTNTIVTCTYGNNPVEVVGELFADPAFTGLGQHGYTLDFSLAVGSAAINLGDALLQPVDSLGSINPEGFLLDNGEVRTADKHSAGAYEFTSLPAINRKPNTFNGSNNKYKYPVVQALIDADLTQNAGAEYMFNSGVPVAKSEADWETEELVNNNHKLHGSLTKGLGQYSDALVIDQDSEVRTFFETAQLLTDANLDTLTDGTYSLVTTTTTATI